VTGRPNTSGGRAIATSENSLENSLPYSAKDQLYEQGSWARHNAVPELMSMADTITDTGSLSGTG
jgi:hypothetical protein